MKNSLHLESGFLKSIWRQILDFSGASGDATYLWPRWLALRAVGAVFVIVFAGIIKDQMALAGPDGLLPVSEFLNHISGKNPGAIQAFFAAPSLFWLSSGEAMIRVISWLGMGAALALLLNLWPRMALFVCWVTFLSFVSTWYVLSGAQLDNLMLETALLCIPFAPKGFRPGLGANSAPSTLALFMMRWFLFRVMFEAGAVKLVAGDPHWRNFSAMDIMYETSPFPTILGYLDHQLPRLYHVFEILLSFFAELIAPVLAIFWGRKGRWLAFISWTLFQAGIQLSNNFGWLNTVSIGLGLLMLDDQMINSAAQTFRLRTLGRWMMGQIRPSTAIPGPRWRHHALAVGLWAHFAFSLFYLGKSCGLRVYDLPAFITAPVSAIAPFGSVNEYYLYAQFIKVRLQVEFLGSNDGGGTWRTYAYRYMPQREDRINSFIAPWFVRFDATLELEAYKQRKSSFFRVVASHLLKPNPAVVALFEENPFPDSPPTVVRMRSYHMRFTDFATLRETGRYWKTELVGDYLPPIYVDADGRIVPFDMTAGEAELQKGNLTAAIEIFTHQFQLGYHSAGFRLADYYLRNIGTPEAKSLAFHIYTKLAQEGELEGIYNLGVCYDHGLGVTMDVKQAADWYRLAASREHALSNFYLGALYTSDRLRPSNDIEAYTALLKADELAQGDDPISKFIRDTQPALLKKLQLRMSAADIETARKNTAL